LYNDSATEDNIPIEMALAGEMLLIGQGYLEVSAQIEQRLPACAV